MSNITNYPFYTAYTQLEEMYGIVMNEDSFETSAITAWQSIGNKLCRMYKVKLHPEPDYEGGWVAQVPCNCDIIESITTNYEDFLRTSAVKDFPGTYASSTETFIESGKFDTPDVYQSGKLVNYRRVGDRLFFNENYGELNLLYKGVYADEEGLPYINRKEVDAIAAFCAYATFRKKSLKTMDANTFLMSLALQKDWLTKCSLARVPEYIDLNEMDEILDAKTSWNRKAYSRSFKPINT